VKGILALDIDGTITVDHHNISSQVASFLVTLSLEGWSLIFITGRTFQWGYEVLQYIHCPYYFAVQNGAILLEMPSRKIVSKKYLDKSYLPVMENACRGEPSSFVIYGGYEYKDICYYRPKSFSPEMLEYIQSRKNTFKENWVEVNSFENLPIQEFASLKAFGTFDSAQRIISRIESQSGLHVPLIRDPFQKDRYVVQATHPHVNKGEVVKDLKTILDPSSIVIAAGDDNNDRTMLALADFKVVMATAPEDMLLIADVIAPPAEHLGIIEGLMKAIEKSGIK
jgi:hydroxymethylpyrimidine pyrophosphatase-like HAD family hydrolase